MAVNNFHIISKYYVELSNNISHFFWKGQLFEIVQNNVQTHITFVSSCSLLYKLTSKLWLQTNQIVHVYLLEYYFFCTWKWGYNYLYSHKSQEKRRKNYILFSYLFCRELYSLSSNKTFLYFRNPETNLHRTSPHLTSPLFVIYCYLPVFKAFDTFFIK